MFITVTHCTTMSKESVCRTVCMLCQQTSLKRWFANVNMTSCCDVTYSVYPVTIATVRRCSILEFNRGAFNQEIAPGINRPLHATGHEHHLHKCKLGWAKKKILKKGGS